MPRCLDFSEWNPRKGCKQNEGSDLCLLVHIYWVICLSLLRKPNSKAVRLGLRGKQLLSQQVWSGA